MRSEPVLPTHPTEQRDLTRLRQEVLDQLWHSSPRGSARRSAQRLQVRKRELRAGHVNAIPAGRASVRRISWPGRTAIGLIVVGVVGLAAGGAGLYSGRFSQPALRWLRFIPYPLAAVNFHFIPLSRGLETGDSLPQTLEPLIEEELIRQLASRYNIQVGAPEVDQRLQALIDQAGGLQQFETALAKTSNLTPAHFSRRVLAPALLKEKVGTALLLDERRAGAPLQQAKQLVSQLKDDPESFEAAAGSTNADVSRAFGGDLGFIRPDQLPGTFRSAVATLKAGQVSDLIPSPDGYRILKVEEVLHDDSGAVETVHLRQVFIAGRSVANMLQEEASQAVIWRFIH